MGGICGGYRTIIVSIALFESVSAQGTNLLIQNGTVAGQEVPHVSVNIIPRKENDGLNLQWDVKQLDEEEMSTIELTLKEGIVALEKEDKKTEGILTEETIKHPTQDPLTQEEKSQNSKREENYLIRQLRRMP